MITRIEQGDIQRTYFWFEKPDVLTYEDPFTHVLLPDLSSATSVSDVSRRLLVPFTNKQGQTMPFITAFMEASRVYIHENINDVEGRNDFCPIYSGTALSLLEHLGLPAKAITVDNHTFLPTEFKELLDLAVARGGDEIAPAKTTNFLLRLMFSETSFTAYQDVLDYVQTRTHLHYTEDELMRFYDVFTLANTEYAEAVRQNFDLFDSYLRYTEAHSIHSVVVFKVGEEVGILDTNQDQNPHPELALMGYVDGYYQGEESDFIRYGINPLRNSPFIGNWDEAVAQGYHPRECKNSVKNKCVRKQFTEEELNKIALPIILRIMEEGTTIWDDTHEKSKLIRRSSTIQIQSRHTLNLLYENGEVK
jgi:hypothetical protein